MNPCPAGKSCDFAANCECSLEKRRKHRSKLSAPFLDRIDLQIEVLQISRADLQKPSDSENSQTVKARVIAARDYQLQRQGCANNVLNNKDIEEHCALSKEDEALLGQIMEKFKLSARAYHRILKVARTIADLEGSENIHTKHISETISYRAMDKYNVG